MVSLVKLKLNMIAVMAAVIGLATLILTAIFMIAFPSGNITALSIGALTFAVGIHVLQWLIGPKIIEMAYKVKPIKGGHLAWISETIEKIARNSNIKKIPKPMFAEIDIPNAFAYGNIFTGYKVAVTKGLIENLPKEEVEAVLAHEIGHIRHKDVEIMMIVSILPTLIFWLGRIFLYFGPFAGGSRRSQEASLIPLIGIALIASSFIFNIFILYLSRLREYYADSHAALSLPFGAKRLQRALARILVASGALRGKQSEIAKVSKFKAFLISDPEEGIKAYGFRNIDEVVEWIKSKKRINPLELFSTHPDPAKRLRFLDQLASSYF
jgi:heat shock protein HtpX